MAVDKLSRQVKFAIAKSVYAPCPEPASISFFNLAPKARGVFRIQLEKVICFGKFVSRFIHGNACLGLAVSGADNTGSGAFIFTQLGREVN